MTKCIVCGAECDNKYPQYEQSDYFYSKIKKDNMEISYVIHYRCVDWIVYRILIKKEIK